MIVFTIFLPMLLYDDLYIDTAYAWLCKQRKDYHFNNDVWAPTLSLGALFLKPLDDALEKMEVFYIRFMDDWVVLATTRHRLRKAVRVVNRCLERLQVSQHPNKTFVGRTSKGFDFLGRHFQRYKILKGCMICVTPKKVVIPKKRA